MEPRPTSRSTGGDVPMIAGSLEARQHTRQRLALRAARHPAWVFDPPRIASPDPNGRSVAGGGERCRRTAAQRRGWRSSRDRRLGRADGPPAGPRRVPTRTGDTGRNEPGRTVRDPSEPAGSRAPARRKARTSDFRYRWPGAPRSRASHTGKTRRQPPIFWALRATQRGPRSTITPFLGPDIVIFLLRALFLGFGHGCRTCNSGLRRGRVPTGPPTIRRANRAGSSAGCPSLGSRSRSA